MTTIITKKDNKELNKRELYLVDSSNAQITCTLWGKQVKES